jgi:hypothetical protein
MLRLESRNGCIRHGRSEAEPVGARAEALEPPPSDLFEFREDAIKLFVNRFHSPAIVRSGFL